MFAAADLEDWLGLMRFPISNFILSWDKGHKQVSSLLAWLTSLFVSVVLGGVAGLVGGLERPKKVVPWALFIEFSLPPF